MNTNLTRPDSSASTVSSANQKDRQQQLQQSALNRVRSHFHQCPVVYNDDPLALPQPVFPVTDFVTSVSASLIEDIADAFCGDSNSPFSAHNIVNTKNNSNALPDVLVGTANRSVGCIVHELSRRMDLPYTLSNWYPASSVGEQLVCKAPGFSGEGVVYLNGLRPGDRVLLVIDLLRSGKNLADLIRACLKVGCVVVGCLCVCEVMEHPGRDAVRGFFDAQCPLHVLVQVSARGERTKVLGVDPAQLQPSPPKTAAISRLTVDDVLAPSAFDRARNLYSLTAAATATSATTTNPETFHRPYVPLTRDELNAKLKYIAEPFYNIPIVKDPKLGYNYCFWQLTDFVPLMRPEMIETMAELCVRSANFNRCDVIVSEADRGGASLAVAIARRTGKPFVLASWSTVVDSQVSDATNVGFSGQGRFFLSGVKNGERCIFVDDLLSSGGTCEGILRALERCGAVALEAVFIGEKLTRPSSDDEDALLVRCGFKRLKASYPDVQVTTLVQLTAYGNRTEPPRCTVG